MPYKIAHECNAYSEITYYFAVKSYIPLTIVSSPDTLCSFITINYQTIYVKLDNVWIQIALLQHPVQGRAGSPCLCSSWSRLPRYQIQDTHVTWVSCVAWSTLITYIVVFWVKWIMPNHCDYFGIFHSMKWCGRSVW